MSQYPRPLGSITHLSASSIAMFQQCPQSWAHSYIFGHKSPSGAAAQIGTVVHKALEQVALKEPVNVDWSIVPAGELGMVQEAIDKLQVEMVNAVPVKLEDRQKFWGSNLVDWRNSVVTELEFRHSWRDDAPELLGYIDKIRVTIDQALEVVDYKTNRQPETLDEWRAKIQPQLYAWVIFQTFPELQSVRFKIEYVLQGGEVAWEWERSELDFVPELLDNVWSQMVAYAQSLELVPNLLDFPQRVGGGCRYCALKSQCVSFRQHTYDLTLDILPKDSIASRYKKIKEIKKLVDHEEKEMKALLMEEIVAFGSVEDDGTVFTAASSHTRVADPKAVLFLLAELEADCQDEAFTAWVKDNFSDIFTAKIGGLDKLCKAFPDVVERVSQLIDKKEESPSIVMKASETGEKPKARTKTR